MKRLLAFFLVLFPFSLLAIEGNRPVRGEHTPDISIDEDRVSSPDELYLLLSSAFDEYLARRLPDKLSLGGYLGQDAVSGIYFCRSMSKKDAFFDADISYGTDFDAGKIYSFSGRASGGVYFRGIRILPSFRAFYIKRGVTEFFYPFNWALLPSLSVSGKFGKLSLSLQGKYSLFSQRRETHYFRQQLVASDINSSYKLSEYFSPGIYISVSRGSFSHIDYRGNGYTISSFVPYVGFNLRNLGIKLGGSYSWYAGDGFISPYAALKCGFPAVDLMIDFSSSYSLLDYSDFPDPFLRFSESVSPRTDKNRLEAKLNIFIPGNNRLLISAVHSDVENNRFPTSSGDSLAVIGSDVDMTELGFALFSFPKKGLKNIATVLYRRMLTADEKELPFVSRLAVVDTVDVVFGSADIIATISYGSRYKTHLTWEENYRKPYFLFSAVLKYSVPPFVFNLGVENLFDTVIFRTEESFYSDRRFRFGVGLEF